MIQPIDIKREELSNGLVLVGNEDRSGDTVAIRGSIKAGAIFDDKGLLGNAEMVSRLLTRGTKNGRSSSKISQLVEEIGATLQFSNNDEAVAFSANCYSGVLKEIIGITMECITQPSFPEEEIELVRSEILSDIRSEGDDTRTRAHREMMSLLFGGEMPYGRDPQGKLESIAQITRQDVEKFHSTRYGPENVVLAMSGNLNFQDSKREVEQLTRNWTGSGKGRDRLDSMRLSHEEKQTEVSVVPMKGKSQADLVLGFQTVPRKSEEYYALNLGNLILGRIGLYGRLGTNVRDKKGLAYYSVSVLQSKTLAGYLAIYAGVNPKNLGAALEGIANELSRIRREDIGEEELSPGKRNLIGALSLALDTSSERVNIIHDLEYYGLGVSEYLSKYDEIVNSLTKEQVRTAFEKFADPKRISLTATGPLESSLLKSPKELLA